MVRVRQRFARPVVSDIPAATRATLAACGHPIRGGDVVAIGTSSRGISNYATIHTDEYIDFWRRVGEAVHRYGCKYIMQLSHSGR